MSEVLEFILRHGYGVVAIAVFIEQMGFPLPAVTVLLAFGALSRSEEFSYLVILALGLGASLAADIIWYQLGRHYGRPVLGWVCRLSLDPDACVRRTEGAFHRYGGWTLFVAKFVPGLNAATVPIAGMMHYAIPRFLLFDGAGALAWTATYAGIGYIFSNQLERVALSIARFGNGFIAVVAVLLGIYVTRKLVKRRRFLRELRTARVTPDQLKAMMEADKDIVIVDLRNENDYATDRARIPGAIRVAPTELDYRYEEIPPNRQIVLYCT
jgi:membrane protein DedA with SNARE-associated domain